MDETQAQLPTAEDFHDPRFASGLDEASAERTFLGKTEAEAEAMFRECFEAYQEDLASMGPRAFQFYVRPAMRYLTSHEAYEDSIVPVYVCALVDAWFCRDPEALRPVAPALIDLLERFQARHRLLGGAADGADEGDDAYQRAQLAAAAQRLRDLPAPLPPPTTPRTPRERRLERERRERGA